MATHSSSHRFHTPFVVMLVAAFLVGGVGITAVAGQAAENLTADVLNSNQRLAPRRVLTYLKKYAPKSAPEKVSCEGVSTDSTAYKGEFIANAISIAVQKNEKYKVSLYLKNTGTSAWVGDSSGCANIPLMRLGTARAHDHKSELYFKGDFAWRGANRIAMKEARVEPNQIATFTFVSQSPNVDDIQKEYFQPVVESVGWLEDAASTLSMDVRVGQYNDDLLYKAFLLNHAGRASVLDTTQPMVVKVNLTKQTTTVTLGDQVIREYLVSTGKPATPTPPGRFKIFLKNELRIGAAAPHYRMPHFQMITPKGVGFHALPYLENDKGFFWQEALNHIGRRVSHGCVRLLPADAEDLYNITQVGTEVVIHY